VHSRLVQEVTADVRENTSTVDDNGPRVQLLDIVVRRGVAFTSGTAFAASDRADHRLIATSLDEADAESIGVSDTQGVSAISACREENRFVTGGFDGEIDAWQWGSTCSRRV
jgi:hypothetical protein